MTELTVKTELKERLEKFLSLQDKTKPGMRYAKFKKECLMLAPLMAEALLEVIDSKKCDCVELRSRHEWFEPCSLCIIKYKIQYIMQKEIE